MQKNQNINSFSVSPSLDEYGIISQEYKSIYLSVEIKDIDVDPLQIYKLLKSENCFYMQKTLPGQSEAYETIMGLKNEKVEKISGQNPVEKIREIIKENKLSTFCSKNYNHNGLFSYFSYECFKYFDKVPKLKKDPNNLPECIIIIPELISTYHHKNKKLIISKKINKPINKNA